jgi:hypothetical protein
MQATKKEIDTWLAERKVVDPKVEKRQNPNGLNRSQYKEKPSTKTTCPRREQKT